MRDEAEAQELRDAYAETIERYRAAFGEPPAGTWISADAAKCTNRVQAAEVPLISPRNDNLAGQARLSTTS